MQLPKGGKNAVFKFRKIQLYDHEDCKLIYRWRSQPEVTKFQYTDLPRYEEHFEWYRDTFQCGKPYWVIEHQGQPIGLINLADTQLKHRRTSWGFYIGELDKRYLGAFIPPYLYNYLFFERYPDLVKIIAEVVAENTNVIKMHLQQGYYVSGNHFRHILKNGVFHDILSLELSRENWEKLQPRYGRFTAEWE